MNKRLKELWFKLVAYSNEKGITEKLKVIWLKIWGKEPAEVDVSIFNDDERFHILNNEKIKQYWEDEKRYKKEKSKLSHRRLFIVIILIFLGCIVIGNIYKILRGNYLVNCLGREVCIYRGPEYPTPTTSCYGMRLHNGDIFTFNQVCDKKNSTKLKNLWYVIRNFDFIPDNLVWTIDQKMNVKMNEINYDIYSHYFNIYSKKYKKFISFKHVLPKKDPFINTDVMLNFDSDVYIQYMTSPPEFIKFCKKYNTKTMTWKACSSLSNKIDVPKRYIGMYNKDNALFITNYSKKNLYDGDWGIKNQKLTKQERLFLVDKNFEMQLLPDFAQRPLYAPFKEDFKILPNGKMIISVRACARSINDGNCSFSWDHLEIYNPETNQFTAEKNIEVLKDNYFDIELPNGNILFINKNSSWIFNNKTNKFEKCSNSEIQKYKQFVKNIDDKLLNTIGVRLSEPLNERVKFIKLNSDKYLLTCGNLNYIYPQCTNAFCASACNNTLYIDFNKMEYKKGPTFLYPHNLAIIQPIENNKIMVIGGLKESQIQKSTQPLSYKYTQIIRINK